jgi:hypothetical protein
MPACRDQARKPFRIHCVLRATKRDDADGGPRRGRQVRLLMSWGSVIVWAVGGP